MQNIKAIPLAVSGFVSEICSLLKYKSNSAVSHIATLSCGRWVHEGAVLPTKI